MSCPAEMLPASLRPFPELANLTEGERRALEMPLGISVSEWADRYFRIPPRGAAEPGPYRIARTPYCRGILDSLTDPGVREITFIKSTQIGGSQVLLAMLGYVIDQDPGTAAYVMPTEDAALDFIDERIKPSIEETPRLRRHMSEAKRDWKTGRLTFPGQAMSLHALYASSVTQLASRPVRWLFLDEIDKFVDPSNEANACSLAEERTHTFGDRALIVRASTPTTSDGRITQYWEASDQRRYFMPCPHCGSFIRFVWANVRWGESRDAEEVLEHELAHYYCQDCGGEIDDEKKLWMLARGVWVPEGASVDREGNVHGARASKHRGFHIWAAYSPFISWSKLVAKFLVFRQQGELQAWVNSWLGEAWIEKERETTTKLIESRKLDYEPGRVPEEAIVLTAGIDVQDGHRFYVVVRAWAAGFRSWLVEAIELHGYEALSSLIAESAWHREGRGDPLGIRLAFIDSGSGSHAPEVYRWARLHPANVRPSKGYETQQEPLRRSLIDGRRTKGKRRIGGLELVTIDTNYFKDQLAGLLHTEPADFGAWWIHCRPSSEYLRQMASEHKVSKRQNGKLAQAVWKPKPGHKANHYWDAEIYALAAATMLRVHVMKPAAGAVRRSRGRHQQSQEHEGWWNRLL